MIKVSIVIYFDTWQTLIFKCDIHFSDLFLILQNTTRGVCFYNELKEETRYSKSIANVQIYVIIFILFCDFVKWLSIGQTIHSLNLEREPCKEVMRKACRVSDAWQEKMRNSPIIVPRYGFHFRSPDYN